MGKIDFVMTYPAYVPLRPDGKPHTVRTGYGDGSIPLFTDEDTFERFVQDGPTNKISGRVTLDSCDAVCRLLRALDGSKVRGGVVVECVAIDPDYEAPRALVYRRGIRQAPGIRSMIERLRGSGIATIRAGRLSCPGD